MLKSLAIKNYALIENLQVDFDEGLSIITGETGAGKSILLGGLNLVLGKRADASLVYDKNLKCVVEVVFQIDALELESFFEQHDLDYDSELIVRREILPSGKSRAFVNDSPTSLNILTELSKELIDVHTQNQNIELSDQKYQFNLIDSLAGQLSLRDKYQEVYAIWQAKRAELQVLNEHIAKVKRDYEYNKFMAEELTSAQLKVGEWKELEEKLSVLSHAEEIQSTLKEVLQQADREPAGLRELLSDIRSSMRRLETISEPFQLLNARWESLTIEADDILADLESLGQASDFDPSELSEVERRYALLSDLLKKHNVADVEELLSIQKGFVSKMDQMLSADEDLGTLQAEIDALALELNQHAGALHQGRTRVAPDFANEMESLLTELEMPHTKVRLKLDSKEEFDRLGKSALTFEISSDNGKTFGPLKKVASGGEKSRIMLASKKILSRYRALPAMIFDEIDAGVSGEVSQRIADQMLAMGHNMQVITITHLPQVAAKGKQHFKVFKTQEGGKVTSNIRKLNEEERIVELAQMLGGTQLTDSAVAHARQLLS